MVFFFNTPIVREKKLTLEEIILPLMDREGKETKELTTTQENHLMKN
jgi:hypothetical protein